MTSAAFVQTDTEPEAPEAPLPEPVMRVAELIAAARARRIRSDSAAHSEPA